MKLDGCPSHIVAEWDERRLTWVARSTRYGWFLVGASSTHQLTRLVNVILRAERI